jgi:hypothetical protein
MNESPLHTLHTLAEITGLDFIDDLLNDTGAAAERGKWLARGAILLAAAEVVVAVRDHVNDRLSPKERRRIVEIVRTSKGRPSNVSDRERKELQAMITKVEPTALAKRVATTGFASRFKRLGKR